MRIAAAALLIIGVMLSSPVFAGSPEAIMGIWNTPEDRARIEIFQCGNKYCGKIIALKEPFYPPDDGKGMGGQTKVDRENPALELRSRPLIGLQNMEGFTYSGDNRWEGGTIYDPKSGKTYKCKMSLPEPNLLKVRGFIGISLLGRTETWTR